MIYMEPTYGLKMHEQGSVVLYFSHHKSPSRILVTFPFTTETFCLLVRFVSLPVDSAEYEPDGAHDDHVDTHVCQGHAVTDNVSRSIVGSINLRSNDGAQIADGDLHGVRRRPFRLPAHVHCRPTECQGDGWVDPSRG